MKINSISYKIDDHLKTDVAHEIRSLITDFILHISDLHRKQLERRKKLCNLEKRNNNQDSKNKYPLPIFNIQAYLLRSENLISRYLAANKSICSVSNVKCPAYTVLLLYWRPHHIVTQVNFHFLCPIEIVQSVYHTNVYTNCVKQHS